MKIFRTSLLVLIVSISLLMGFAGVPELSAQSQNDPPVVDDIPNQSISEGASFAVINLDNYVDDVDNTDAEMTWSHSGNTEMTVSIDNRVATIGIPATAGWSGAETITFTATDPGGLSDEDSAVFTVSAVNDPPVVSDIPNQSISEGASFAVINLDNYVDDVDNTDAEMTWSHSGNTELTVSIDNRVATIGIPATAGWSGAETITFTATDPGGLSDEDSAVFTVSAVNDPPVVSDIPNQSISEGASFAVINLDNYVDDVDNTDAEMTWSHSGNTEMTVSIDNRVATIGIPATAGWSGAETITFTATDPGGLSDEDSAVFTVSAVNDPPVVSDIPNQSISEGASFAVINLDNYVDDVDNTDAEMTWSHSGNTEMTVSIDNRVATIGIPATAGWSGAETITFTATDPGGLSDEDSATFTVTPVTEKYNVVVIVTDDQRWDTIGTMPLLQDRLVTRGVVFEDAYVSSPSCGPSRAGFLAGGFYAHNTGVLTNDPPNGGFGNFIDTDALAVKLSQAGYETAMIGKYLNGYESPYQPPGWTLFFETEGFDAEILSERAIEFIDEYGHSPFFVYMAPYAPHYPANPIPQDQDLFSDFTYRGRGYLEADISDKPVWVAENFSDSNESQGHFSVAEQDEFHRDQLRTLQSVDRAVAEVFDYIDMIGELDRTVFIFTSDNGYLWAEHGLFTKGVPYEESIRVPLVVAVPGIPARVDDHLVVGNLDAAATILDMAGVENEGDGLSLLPLLEDPQAPWRNHFLIELWGYAFQFQDNSFTILPWAGIRHKDEDLNMMYVDYVTGEKELYDLSVDPYELENSYNDPGYLAAQELLSNELDLLRGVALTTPELPEGTKGEFYDFQLDARGGNGSYSWSIVEGSLPPGIVLNSETGALSGIPIYAGQYSVSIKVEDTRLATYTEAPQAYTSLFTRSQYTITITGFNENLAYTPVTPCRIVDTRNTAAGMIAASTQRDFHVYGLGGPISAQGGTTGGCPSPLGEPLAAHISMVAVNPTGKGNLKVFPKGASSNAGLSVNFNTIDTNLANAGTVSAITGIGPDITVASNFSSAHVTIQVLGYYYPNGDFLYTPVTPCEIVDTRNTSAGMIDASTQRNFHVYGLGGTITAQGGNAAGCPSPLGEGEPLAAHINMVAVNPTGKGNLKAFPVGTGATAGLSVNYNTIDTNLANAGTVKTIAGAGPDITVASNFSSAHVTIQVLGYYYPNGDLLYTPVTPCKIVDTRNTSAGMIGASSQRNFFVRASGGTIAAQGGDAAGCPSPVGEPLAAHISMVAVNPTGKGNLTAFPVGASSNAGLSVNYNTIDTNLANAGTVKTIAGAGPDITVASNFSSADVTIQILGYYYPAP